MEEAKPYIASMNTFTGSKQNAPFVKNKPPYHHTQYGQQNQDEKEAKWSFTMTPDSMVNNSNVKDKGFASSTSKTFSQTQFPA